MIAENLTASKIFRRRFRITSSRSRHNKRDALAYKINDAWNYINGNEVVERIKRIAMGLAAWA
ncbi:MAG: hypothetical protein IPG58_04720 [Acidobacteria bacterium]|nr:hypothetical protein [Acidobacteriota bacterium]